jgi:TRAP transporter TAXI family solute receptor
MRRLACAVAVLAAALLTLAAPVLAQPVKRPVAAPALTPAAKFNALRDKLNQNTVTVISGNPNGTYLYLAYDMSAVLDDGDNLRVLPVIGKGGYQNVMDVLHLRGVDLCITQSNIMTYLKETGEMGPNIEHRLAFITRLYNEEMHILAGAGINSIKDLNGKKVNFSDVGSGTQFSTRLIFKLLGIKTEEVNMGQADGFQKVKTGEIAATVLIAGKPTGSFAKFKLEPGMKLLPVPYADALEQDYLPAKLTHADYPNLIEKDQSVDSVAIASVLASYNWPRDTDRYRRVAMFVDAFFAKFAEFQQPARHAKWREANINSSLTGWKRFPAAEEWLAKNAGRPSAAIDPAIVRAQAAKAAPNDPAAQEKLYREFMEWTKAQSKR